MFFFHCQTLQAYYWSDIIGPSLLSVLSASDTGCISQALVYNFWLWQLTEGLSGIISPSLKNKKDKKNIWRITLKKFQIFFLKKKFFLCFEEWNFLVGTRRKFLHFYPKKENSYILWGSFPSPKNKNFWCFLLHLGNLRIKAFIFSINLINQLLIDKYIEILFLVFCYCENFY